jgi:hypothetical protein
MFRARFHDPRRAERRRTVEEGDAVGFASARATATVVFLARAVLGAAAAAVFGFPLIAYARPPVTTMTALMAPL